MTKKILIIIIVIILFFAIAGVFFFAMFSSKNKVVLDNSSRFKGFIFGNSGTENGNNGEVIVGKTRGEINEPLLKLREISKEPTAGFISFMNDNGETMVRYIERATGHIYEASTVSPTIKRISNTTVPRIYEALWLDKNSLVIRYLDDNNETIKSFYAEIVKNKEDLEEGKIEGVFLMDNIKDIISYGSKILSILINRSGSQLVVSNPNGENRFELFNSPLKEWSIQRPKSGLIILITKPAFRSSGYIFSLDTRTLIMKKVLGDINGLTALFEPNARKILLAEKLDLFLYDVGNRELKNLE